MDDVEQIKQLKARYFRRMDTKDWAGLVEVFTSDVIIDMRGEGGGVTESASAFVTPLSEMLADVVTVHHGHMPEMTIDSKDSASGVWAMEDMLWWPEGSPLKHLHGYGHYHETYARTVDGWRIATMTLTRLRRDIEFS